MEYEWQEHEYSQPYIRIHISVHTILAFKKKIANVKDVHKMAG